MIKDSALTLLSICCITLGACLGATAVSMLGVDAMSDWASDWGGLIGSVLSGLATIAAGAIAWFAATRPERQARVAVARALTTMLDPLAKGWRMIDENGNKDSVHTHGLIRLQLIQAEEFLQDSSLERSKAGLNASDRLPLDEVEYLIPFIASEIDALGSGSGAVHSPDPARIYTELRVLLTDLAEHVSDYDDTTRSATAMTWLNPAAHAGAGRVS